MAISNITLRGTEVALLPSVDFPNCYFTQEWPDGYHTNKNGHKSGIKIGKSYTRPTPPMQQTELADIN